MVVTSRYHPYGGNFCSPPSGCYKACYPNDMVSMWCSWLPEDTGCEYTDLCNDFSYLINGFLIVVPFVLWAWINYRSWANSRAFSRSFHALSENESLRPGSEFLELAEERKNYVAAVSLVWWATSMKTLVGSCFKMEWENTAYLITASHVLSKMADIVLQFADGTCCKTEPRDWVKLAPDVSVLPLTGKFAHLASKLRTLHPGTAKRIDVNVVSAYDSRNGSVGLLRGPNSQECDSVGFGRVVYGGSTRAGFSGAPYINGKTVHGMHTNGGQLNTGYSASYIMMLLKMHFRNSESVPESSEIAMVQRALRTAQREDIEFQPVGQDEVQIKLGGQYFVLDTEDFYQVRRNNPDYFIDGRDYSKKYRDEIPEGVEVDPVIQHMDHAFEVLEKRLNEKMDHFLEKLGLDELRVKKVETSLSSIQLDLENHIDSQNTFTNETQDTLDAVLEVLDGQKETQDQLKEACDSMFNIGLKHLETSLNQQIENLKQQLQELRSTTPTYTNNPPCQDIPCSENISTPSCLPSKTSLQQPDLGCSVNIPQLPTRSVGMDEAFEEFKKWRSSTNTSVPEYASLREQFLTTLGLNDTQKNALIKRLRNWLQKQKVKMALQRMKENVQESASLYAFVEPVRAQRT